LIGDAGRTPLPSPDGSRNDPQGRDLQGCDPQGRDLQRCDLRGGGQGNSQGKKEAVPAGSEKWGKKTLKDVFRERRIEVKGRPARLLIGAVAIQLIVVAALLGTQAIPQHLVASGVPDGAGGLYLVPEASLVTMAVSIGAAYCLALAAALRIRSTAAGLVVVAATVYSLYPAPLSKLQEGGPVTGLHAADVWLRSAQLGVLALLGILALGTAIARRNAAAGREAANHKAPHDNGPHHMPATGGKTVPRQATAASPAGRRVWLVPALAASCGFAYFALEVGAWGAYARAGQAVAGTESLVDDLSLQTLLVPLVLTLVVFLYSTDLLDWGEIVTGRIVYLTARSRPRCFRVLTPLAALPIVANVLWRAPSMVPRELLVGAVIAGVIALLTRRTGRYAGWSDELRSRAVVMGAVAYFAYTTGLFLVTDQVSGAVGVPEWDLYWRVAVPLLAGGLAVGSYLIARGKPRGKSSGKVGGEVGGKPSAGGRSEWRTLLLFLVLMGMMMLALSLVEFPGTVGLPAIFPAHYSPVDGVQLVTALAALGWSGWAVIRRRPATRLDELFGLLVCLALVTGIAQMLSGISLLSALSPYPLVAFFLGLGAWGVISSGDQLNGDSDRYPRLARLMLFASYTIMTNGIVGFLGTLRTPGSGKPPLEYLTADYTTPAGLATMGSAIVIVAYFLRHLPAQESQQHGQQQQEPPHGQQQHGQQHQEPPHGQQQRLRPHGTARIPVRLRVTLAVVLVLGLAAVAGCSSPQASGPYKAARPGPECDKNGALWTVPRSEPVTTQCTSAGVRVTVSADNAGDVQFQPPADSFPRNYSVSVKVTFGSLTDGCASIYTRSSGDGHYTSYVCDSQGTGHGYQWGLERITPHKQWLLALGQLATSSGTYALTATADGSSQYLTINGAAASGSDSALSTTRYIALGISDAGSQPGSVTFSDFTFTSLPATGSAASGAGAPRLPITTPDRVAVWFTDYGKAEIALLESRLTAVGKTTTLSEQAVACGALATAVTTARADPQVPDTAARPWLSQALAEYGKAAANCQAGAESGNTAESNEAASQLRLAGTDITQFEAAIAQDGSPVSGA
jgi:hypothetical protein